MANAPEIAGALASLLPMLPEHVTEQYVGWLNDFEVMRYTEARYTVHSRESVLDYVLSNLDHPDAILWRIVDADRRHVGNLRLSGLSSPHKRGEVALIIGEKSCWGKGYGPAAITLAVDYCLNVLGFHKVTAGAYAINEASRRAFLKCGFVVEATLKEHYLFEGRFIDGLLFGLRADTANGLFGS